MTRAPNDNSNLSGHFRVDFLNSQTFANIISEIVYIDKKQGQKLERLAERQLFGNYSSLDPNCIIHQPQCIYKLKEMESIDRARSLTNKALETRDSCESLANQRNIVEHDSHEERI